MQNLRKDINYKAKESVMKKAYNANRYDKEKEAENKRMQRLKKRCGRFTNLSVYNLPSETETGN